MPHAALTPGAVAVITGGASGIGLAAARRFAALGLTVCIADLGKDRLSEAVRLIRAEAVMGADVAAYETDVADRTGLEALEAAVTTRFGGTDVLMNNAAIQTPTDAFGPTADWRRLLEVNLWGVIDGSQAFAPNMVKRGRPGLIINTGSKQGITTPPGNPAYNVSKSGVKTYTEALQHQLRNTPGHAVSAHLLIPGYVFTPLAAGDRPDKPAGAWTADQTIDFMLERLTLGDFYILCPDEDVDRALDEKRIAWAAGDLINNRPPLSRWHPEYAPLFDAFIAGPGGPKT
ncbi:SDR family NAD(P)-dependent oxidoreductase [Brevundimonas nasdae]|uniref:SDR family NAD(P)-dependent oxidoreductase n=1 Tax=Brevundimonas nasdae TaxID=172043 RepID=A0ABX8TM83_9CAUL|nr:SDR family NAD(P)-dependent oxidoreductase [Brevundimonas nasdae]QYC11470.1 SDR family NAD(P)-dependent oxidoreductase [Brevundimonas nasdae]QYC14258.1 SDR family NAD(P)-dependent oxidoreductase [Brevundimonas nasdae]